MVPGVGGAGGSHGGWTYDPWIKVGRGGAKAGHVPRRGRPYTVCSCGHWAWDDLLAKRKWLCVRCQDICDPYGHSTRDTYYPICCNGSAMALADDPHGGDGGAKPGGGKAKGRWRKGQQAQQAQQAPPEAIPPQAIAAVKEAASHLAPDLAQKLLAQFVPKAPPQPQASPQAEWQRASQAKKASQEKT